MYYRSHNSQIDTIIGHSLGASVGLALEKEYKKEGGNPYGIIQSKSFGAPVVSGNIKSPLLKDIVKNEIVGAGVAGGLAIGASADSVIGFSDGGLLSGLGADIGKKCYLIFLIELHQVLIQDLIEYDILVILFLLLTSMQPQECHLLYKDGTIQHIHIQVYS